VTKGRSLGILLFVIVSCTGWVAFVETSPTYHPWGDLSRGSFTDHFSHMNAARAFARIGTEIYKRGPKDVYPPPAPIDFVRLPPDVRYGGSWTGGIYALPGLAKDKPWVTSWSDRPRLYPPGDLLLVAPVAVLYDRTDMSLAEACSLLIMLFVVYAHVSLYVGFRFVAPALRLSTPVLWLCVALIYLEAVHWALEGFYDFAVGAPLILCLRYLKERRAIAASLAYCIAAFCHFRVFFLAPLALFAVWIFVEDRQWRGLRKRDWAALVAIAALSGVTLWVFRVLYPFLTTMPITNPIHPAFWPVSKEATLWFLAVAAVALAVMVYAEAWVDAAMVLWMGGMMLVLREAQPWHVMVLLVWLLAPPFYARADGAEAVRLGRFLLLGFGAVWMLRSILWPSWLYALWRP
jgi:hypothetical protein